MASVGPQDLSCSPCYQMTQESFSLSSAYQVCADPFTFKDSTAVNNNNTQNTTKPVNNTNNNNNGIKPEISSSSSSVVGIAVGVSVGLIVLIGGAIGGLIIWKKKREGSLLTKDSSANDIEKKGERSSRSTLANIKAGLTERNKDESSSAEFSMRNNQNSLD